jgi:hypothetical protein
MASDQTINSQLHDNSKLTGAKESFDQVEDFDSPRHGKNWHAAKSPDVVKPPQMPTHRPYVAGNFQTLNLAENFSAADFDPERRATSTVRTQNNSKAAHYHHNLY